MLACTQTKVSHVKYIQYLGPLNRVIRPHDLPNHWSLHSVSNSHLEVPPFQHAPVTRHSQLSAYISGITFQSMWHLLSPSLSFSSHHPNPPLQVAPEAPWVRWYLDVRPHLLPNLVMCRALQNQVLCRFFCTPVVGTCSGVLLPNTMEVRRQHRRVASKNLCYRDKLTSGPVSLLAIVQWITARQRAINSWLWIVLC